YIEMSRFLEAWSKQTFVQGPRKARWWRGREGPRGGAVANAETVSQIHVTHSLFAQQHIQHILSNHFISRHVKMNTISSEYTSILILRVVLHIVFMKNITEVNQFAIVSRRQPSNYI